MGEANRRKKLDPSWGKENPPSLVVEVSEITGKWLIVLRHEGNRAVISPHVSKEGLELGLRQCESCLEKMGKNKWRNNFYEAKSEFLELLRSEFSYPDDDEIIGIYTNGAIDFDVNSRNEAMANINIGYIHSHGKRLFSCPPTEIT